MVKNDMRWQRTERNIADAFGAMLEEQPVDKIAVTELSRRADINKATFYLHYRDIYDLAGAYARQEAERAVDAMEYLADFFDAPERFVRSIVTDLSIQREKRAMRAFVESNLLPVFMDGFTDRMGARLSALRPMQGNRHEDIMLTFLVNGLFAAVARYADTDREELVRTACHLLSGIREYGERHFGLLDKANDAGASRGFTEAPKVKRCP